MTLSDFDYELPAERIAQRPPVRRDDARLLVLDRAHGNVADARFRDLPARLRAGDLLVLNDTRVVPSRLVGHKASGGRIELLLVERVADAEWSCLVRAARAPAPGTRLVLGQGLEATVLGRTADRFHVRIDAPAGDVAQLVAERAQIPLPPYIARPEPIDPALAALDRERYQTVFARAPGAVAAPTAGLHFTPEMLSALAARGVRTAFVTLHVGPGTFQPVRTERIEDHVLGAEPFAIPDDTARAIACARGAGGRVVAVGTTVVRTLEHRARPDGTVDAGERDAPTCSFDRATASASSTRS